MKRFLNVGDASSKIVWTGELTGPLGRTGYRQTISKKGDREISLLLELKEPPGAAGKYAPISEVDCKR